MRRGKDETILGVAECIEQLITVDLTGRGSVGKLYSAARTKTDGSLLLEASRQLEENLSKASTVIIATGWPDRTEIDISIAESDGPPGAVLLARALHRAFDVVPILLTEEQLVPGLEEVMNAAGLRVVEPEMALKGQDITAPVHTASVLPLPVDVSLARETTRKLIDKYAPGAVIVVEKGGESESGAIYSCRGKETTETIGKADELIRQARKNDVFTLGIGDGGNEVGMGIIQEEAAAVLANNGGPKDAAKTVPVVETDALVVSSVSNWGAYGLAACLAVIVCREDVFHNENTERRVLETCGRWGFIDGVTGYVSEGVDGVPIDVHCALVKMLGFVVKHGIVRSCNE